MTTDDTSTPLSLGHASPSSPDSLPPGDGTDNRNGGESSVLPSYVVDNRGHHMKVQGPHEYVRKNPEFRAGYFASIMTLCLAIMGGAVFPVPWAFSITGAVAGAVICVVVAAANVFTSDLLIRQCYKTGSRDYEELAFAVGGTPWLVVTRISIVVLLFGSMIATVQQAAESAVTALQAVIPEVPAWLLYADDTGYVLMLLFTVVISYPLCMFKELRSLEYAGVAGFLAILFLTGSVIIEACKAGLPALESGDFPVVGFTSLDSIAQAVSILGFAFYIQPLMMPLLNEMPGPPRSQARILSWAMRFTVVVFAGGVYFLMGFFGAAWYGTSTEGNILQNPLLGGGTGQAVINFIMAVYLSLSFPTMEFCTRRVIDNWLPGGGNQRSFLRNFLITTGIIIAVLLVAMFWHSGSENLLVVTGATGVLFASYVCPVVNHFLLFFGWAKCQKAAEEEYSAHLSRVEGSQYEGHVALKVLEASAVPLGEALPPIGANSIAAVGQPGVLTYAHEPAAHAFSRVLDSLSEIVAPALIVAFGVLCSFVSLYTTFKPSE